MSNKIKLNIIKKIMYKYKSNKLNKKMIHKLILIGFKLKILIVSIKEFQAINVEKEEKFLLIIMILMLVYRKILMIFLKKHQNLNVSQSSLL